MSGNQKDSASTSSQRHFFTADPNIHISRMQPSDTAEAARIDSQVYPSPWDENDFMKEISTATRHYLVARTQNQVAGYAGMMFSGNRGHVTNIAVAPEFRGRLIGTGLLLGLTYEGIAKGVTTVSLEVRVPNIAAQRLYEKFGFRIVGIKRDYYKESREDALVMQTTELLSTSYRRRLDRLLDQVTEAWVLPRRRRFAFSLESAL